MKLFKMSIVKTEEFEKAFNACQMAFGCISIRKKTLIWIVSFEVGDYEIIRETLEEVGSVYKGNWHM